jgi:hypothetical protein
MYGMIHKAVLQMAEEQAAQERVKAGLNGLPAEWFISASHYPDAVTGKIIDFGREAMGMDGDAFMYAFGRYWIEFADRGPYADIMRLAGSDIRSFIGHLDQMHAGIGEVMIEARMPSFRIVDERPGRIDVAYQSTRDGLEPMVKGLLAAIMTRFGHMGTVEQIAAEGPVKLFRLTLGDEL